MSIIERLKRFWIRKILRKVYDPIEIIENHIPIDKMNRAEVLLTIDTLHSSFDEMQQDIKLIIYQMSETGAICDKCNNYNGVESICWKCSSSGITRSRQLCDWPWEI